MSKKKIERIGKRPAGPSQADISKVIDKLIVRLWETINDLESIEPSPSRFFRVAIFGSSRITRGGALFEEVKTLAAHLSDMGCDIVTGGGPGLMEAANEGAKQGSLHTKTRSFGLTIQLPFENSPNPYVDRVTAHRTFFSRLHHFARMSNAYVVFPGGIGTGLEVFMIWQLLQVKHLVSRPLVFMDQMWQGLINWTRDEMVSRKLCNPEDLDLVSVAHTMDEAVEIIRKAKDDFDQQLKTGIVAARIRP
ncbi:MAG: LOG family protein [Acidobacteria bacterium]|nr:LOG family protein [Acidobacteriota bacterium]